MQQPPVAFGHFVLDRQNGTLLRAGDPLPIGYRAMLLLDALAHRPGEVLGKDELMKAAWPDAIVEESNLTVQISGLRRLLGERPDGGEWIVTVPRLGYRFAQGTSPRASQHDEPRPSIAILPFKSLSTDPDQEVFADGLVEELGIRLARLRWLTVASRLSAFSFKGQAAETRRIGRELGVRYTLDGSVRRVGDDVRVACELSDTSTGTRIWADRYDSHLDGFFDVQDRITAAVVAAIEPELYVAEHERARLCPPGHLDAWTLVMQAMPFAWTWGTKSEITSAAALLERALALDADYARANSLLAWTKAARVQLGLDERREELNAARETAMRALRRDPQDPWTHLAFGYVAMVGREFDAAVAALGEAIELNPSLALAHVILGSTYGYGGMGQAGLHHLAIAARLSPRDFSQAANSATVGLCQIMTGSLDLAVANFRRAVELRPHFGTAWRSLAAAAGLAGELDTATRALVEARRLQPRLSLAWIDAFHPIVKLADRERYKQGLVAAGLAL